MTEKFDRTSPKGAVKYFRNCILEGDLTGAVSCFHPEATYIARDGQEVKGLENIEKALVGICSWEPQIEGIKEKVTIVGGLAIWIDKYAVKAKTAEGDPLEFEGSTACLLKKDSIGNWLWLVDNPFASDQLMG